MERTKIAPHETEGLCPPHSLCLSPPGFPLKETSVAAVSLPGKRGRGNCDASEVWTTRKMRRRRRRRSRATHRVRWLKPTVLSVKALASSRTCVKSTPMESSKVVSFCSTGDVSISCRSDCGSCTYTHTHTQNHNNSTTQVSRQGNTFISRSR